MNNVFHNFYIIFPLSIIGMNQLSKIQLSEYTYMSNIQLSNDILRILFHNGTCLKRMHANKTFSRHFIKNIQLCKSVDAENLTFKCFMVCRKVVYSISTSRGFPAELVNVFTLPNQAAGRSCGGSFDAITGHCYLTY